MADKSEESSCSADVPSMPWGDALLEHEGEAEAESRFRSASERLLSTSYRKMTRCAA